MLQPAHRQTTPTPSGAGIPAPPTSPAQGRGSTITQALMQRLQELAPNSEFSEADLLQCQRNSPAIWRLVKVSLERASVDFTDQELEEERARVHHLKDEQIGVLMRAVARFTVGEKIVEDELSPLLSFYKKRGQDADRAHALYIAIQQAEEKIHAEFFKRYSEVVFGASRDSAQDARMQMLCREFLNTDDDYSKPFRKFFTESLPSILKKAETSADSKNSTLAEISALACYHVFAEGVVAETAYFGFQKALGARGDKEATLPTILKGITMIKDHESTHIAFGILRLREILDRPLISRVARLGWLAVRGAIHLPSVAEIVIAVHREHPGEFPFPLDRVELAKNGVQQFLSRCKQIFKR
jgi:hypothetical protein